MRYLLCPFDGTMYIQYSIAVLISSLSSSSSWSSPSWIAWAVVAWQWWPCVISNKLVGYRLWVGGSVRSVLPHRCTAWAADWRMGNLGHSLVVSGCYRGRTLILHAVLLRLCAPRFELAGHQLRWWYPGCFRNINTSSPSLPLSPSWLSSFSLSSSSFSSSNNHALYIPVVQHKAVAEVSKLGRHRRGELLWCMDGRANPLMDRKVVGWGCVFWSGCNGCSGHLAHNCWIYCGVAHL